MSVITDKNFKSNNSEFMSNKEKQQQIDEIAECVLGGTIAYRLEVAELIYNKGYRKQSVGEWATKDLNNPLYESKKAPHCSNCEYMSFIRYDYCPNCGAKMKGECE